MWTVRNSVEEGLLSLKPTDTCSVARELIIDQEVFHLPVIRKGKIEFFVSISDLEDLEEQQLLTEIKAHKIPNEFCLQESQHYFEALHQMLGNSKVVSMSVVDEDNDFIGIVRMRDLANNYIPQNYLTQEASLVILEMDDYDYSLTKISNIVEYNRCAILQVVAASPGNKKMWVQLIINSTTIQSVLKGFERYSYKILYANNHQSDQELDDRYQSLLKYLDL